MVPHTDFLWRTGRANTGTSPLWTAGGAGDAAGGRAVAGGGAPKGSTRGSTRIINCC